MAIPMPTFIKSLFDTFPLVTYPPIHARPAPRTSRNSRTFPSSSQQPAAQDPTLFVRSRHAPSLAAQLLVLRSGSRAINVWLTTMESADLPYVYVHGAGGTVIHGPALSSWITATHSKANAKTKRPESRKEDLRAGGIGVRITESVLAFSSLLTVLDETYLLAAHRDGTQRHILGLWRDTLVKPNAQMQRLLNISWDMQLQESKEAFRALSVYVEAAEEETDGVMKIKAALVAQVHVILGTQRGHCVSQLQETVNQYPIILKLHDEWIEQYGRQLLY